MKQTIYILSLSILTAQSAFAALPPQTELDLRKIKKIEPANKVTSDDVAKVIPTELQPGEDQNEIGLKIADRSANSITQGDFFRQSDIGRAANAVQNSLKTEMSLGGGEGHTTHNIQMQVLAFEQKAFIRYAGFTHFKMTYLNYKNDLDLEVSEKIGDNTDFVLTHDVNASLSAANVRWSF